MEEKDIVVHTTVLNMDGIVPPEIISMPQVHSFLYSLGWKVDQESVHSFLIRGGRFSVGANGHEYAFRKA